MNHDLVTIFGGSGFVGRYAVRALAKRGYRIRVAVRHPNLANYLLPMGHVGQIQLLRANVTNADAVAAAVGGASAVINLVGLLQESSRQHFSEVHAEAAGLLARTARAEGATTFVHISTAGVEANAESAYARTKAEGERRVREHFPQAAILKPSILFGPEDNFFNRFAALARISKVMPLIGGGRTRFQPVYVGDVARAIACCIERDFTQGCTYELGGPKIYTFRQLIELILRETGRRRLLISVPFPLAMLQATLMAVLPKPPLTRDQVRLLKTDNVVSPGALGLGDLGIEPEPLEAILPTYLWRFRREGQYEHLSEVSAKLA